MDGHKESLRRGDRVKLTDSMAKMAMRGFCNLPRKVPVDWINRRGTVVHNPMPGASSISIVWDGMKAFDRWPINAVERDV